MINLLDRFYQNIFYRLNLNFESMEISFLKIFDFLRNVNVMVVGVDQKIFE